MKVLTSAMIAGSCLGFLLANVAFGGSGYQFELVPKDGKVVVPVPEQPKPSSDVGLKARARLVMVQGKSKCELFAFQDLPKVLGRESKLVIRDTNVRPSAIVVPPKAILGLLVYDGNRLIDSSVSQEVDFKPDAQLSAKSTPCVCLPPPARTAGIAFDDPFKDISGKLQLVLTCDDCFKQGKVKKVRVEAYLQFIPEEGKRCCCYHKLDNHVTIEITD